MKLGRKILEGYLAVAIVLLTIVVFMVLGTVSMETSPGISLINILIIILVGIEILQAIIQMRILENTGEE